MAALWNASLAVAAEAVIVVQRSPLAGFRHYEGSEAWRHMAVGDRLQLVREGDNPYDANAIRVEWRGLKLGYVPRRDNAAVARQMDRGILLEARVAALRENRNRSVRIEFEIVTLLQ
ncbi:HIRAN domain protein [compost metagenome]